MICEKCGLPEYSKGDDIYSSYCKCNDMLSGGYPRMSLRDYFAGLAMQGIVMNYDRFSDIAKDAYEIADAMLEARKI